MLLIEPVEHASFTKPRPIFKIENLLTSSIIRQFHLFQSVGVSVIVDQNSCGVALERVVDFRFKIALSPFDKSYPRFARLGQHTIWAGTAKGQLTAGVIIWIFVGGHVDYEAVGRAYVTAPIPGKIIVNVLRQ